MQGCTNSHFLFNL